MKSGSFILGLVVGMAGMALEAYAWIKTQNKDRMAFNKKINRYENMIRKLMDENCILNKRMQLLREKQKVKPKTGRRKG